MIEVRKRRGNLTFVTRRPAVKQLQKLDRWNRILEIDVDQLSGKDLSFLLESWIGSHGHKISHRLCNEVMGAAIALRGKKRAAKG